MACTKKQAHVESQGGGDFLFHMVKNHTLAEMYCTSYHLPHTMGNLFCSTLCVLTTKITEYGTEWDDITFKRRIKSRLPFAGIIRSSPYSPSFQDNG